MDKERAARLMTLLEVEERLIYAQTEGMFNDDGTVKGLTKAFQIIHERFNEIFEEV